VNKLLLTLAFSWKRQGTPCLPEAILDYKLSQKKDHARWQGLRRCNSGAYTKYVSILKSITTPPEGIKLIWLSTSLIHLRALRALRGSKSHHEVHEEHEEIRGL
jgi:hypothetical protein